MFVVYFPWWRHDDVKWKHFPHHWSCVRGVHRSPLNSLHKGQWRGALMFSLLSAWLNAWVNNREAGDLRSYRAHFDVTVMRHIFQTFIIHTSIHSVADKIWWHRTEISNNKPAISQKRKRNQNDSWGKTSLVARFIGSSRWPHELCYLGYLRHNFCSKSKLDTHIPIDIHDGTHL